MININEYQQRDYNAKIKLLNELNSMSGVYKFELLENKEEPDKGDILLTGIIPIHARYNEYEKQYDFFLFYNLPYVRYDTYNKTSTNYKQPQNVGVLTEKKIKAWVDYLINIFNDLVEISKERVGTISAFEAEMVKLGARIGKKDPYGTFDGYVVKNGIEFKFTVHNEGYISKNIEIHYIVQDTIDNFLRLSDNKYTDRED